MEAIKKNNLLNIDLLLGKTINSNNCFVADLGCGSFGYLVFPLTKKIGSHGKVYAVDILKGSLENIKKRARLENLDQVKTVWSNLEVYNGTDIKSDSLDVAFLVSVLHQSDKYVDIIKEALRTLKKGGRLLIVEWENGNSFFGNVDKKTIDKKEMLKALKTLPLNLEEEFKASEHHYGLLLTKI
jgi:ubiquinone/menaquinone biosynthesis C-methylase UbiE